MKIIKNYNRYHLQTPINVKYSNFPKIWRKKIVVKNTQIFKNILFCRKTVPSIKCLRTANWFKLSDKSSKKIDILNYTNLRFFLFLLFITFWRKYFFPIFHVFFFYLFFYNFFFEITKILLCFFPIIAVDKKLFFKNY